MQVRLCMPLGVTGKLGEGIGPLSAPCHLLHIRNMGRASKTICCAGPSEPHLAELRGQRSTAGRHSPEH